MKKRSKIILAIVIGFVMAMIIMSVAIYFGYTTAYDTNVNLWTVKIVGIPIYDLSISGDAYIGSPKGIYMGLFCGICMCLAVVIQVIIDKIRRK